MESSCTVLLLLENCEMDACVFWQHRNSNGKKRHASSHRFSNLSYKEEKEDGGRAVCAPHFCHVRSISGASPACLPT